MKPLRISPQAAHDLLAISEYLESESGYPLIGDRFLSAAASTFKIIEDFPGSGRLRPARNPRLTGLRSLSLDSPFNKYLAFYQPSEDAFLVIRVLHGAQDLSAILTIDM